MAGKDLLIDRLYTVNTDEDIPASRKRLGSFIFWGASALVVAVFLIQALHVAGASSFGFVNWRPALYSVLVWCVALCAVQVISHGEAGKKLLFVLPAFLFTVIMVIFPTLFGLYIAFTDWNLSSLQGQRFNGTDNLVQMWHDPYFWNALLNMLFYAVAVIVEYAIAFSLALLLNAEIRGRKFFRVAFLLPFMLSPVAVSWMIGKSLAEYRFGPLATLARELGWAQPTFFTSPFIARISITLMDAWTYIPFMMIMLLAGLQAMPKEVQVDHRDHPAHHLQAEARRHRHQRYGRRTRRRHRYGHQLHLPRISRTIECRLRHDAGLRLSRHHHSVRDRSAQACKPLEHQPAGMTRMNAIARRPDGPTRT
jgi:multiple sugar transport system permease protein